MPIKNKLKVWGENPPLLKESDFRRQSRSQAVAHTNLFASLIYWVLTRLDMSQIVSITPAYAWITIYILLSS